MSVDRCFSILGDSNVKRFVTMVNRRASRDLDSSRIILCGKIGLLADALQEVRAESDVCIVTCISNFVSSAADSSSNISLRIEPLLA